MSPNRLPAGLRGGGQFTTGSSPRAAFSLDTQPSGDQVAGFLAGPPPGHTPSAPGLLDRYDQTRHARDLLRQALLLGADRSQPSDSVQKFAYGAAHMAHTRGREQAATIGAAYFLTPNSGHGRRGEVIAVIRAAIERQTSADESGLRAVLASTQGLIDCTGAPPSAVERNSNDLLHDMVQAHRLSAPGSRADSKNEEQWTQAGLRDGLAKVVARWAASDRDDHAGRGEDIIIALDRGVTDIEQLRRIARGDRSLPSSGLE